MPPITLVASLSALGLLAMAPARAADAPSSPSTSIQPAPEASYGVPLAEILGFQLLLNQFDRHSLTPRSTARTCNPSGATCAAPGSTIPIPFP